jgi:hypothetical protein
MEIEDRLRSRIEAILTNDAKNYAEMKRVAVPDEPLEIEPFAEERNLYQRIINNYRNAISEVNSLLEEHIDFLSGFYRITENIKETSNFRDICAQIVGCALQHFGAEYCSLLFPDKQNSEAGALCLEGVRENRKFVRVHSSPSLLGSEEFETILGQMTLESAGCLNLGDVYREPRFIKVDFPSVVRSLVCLPISLRDTSVGLLVLGNSRPRYFNENHIRVLKILASTVAHLRFLTSQENGNRSALDIPPAEPKAVGENDVYSIVILDFEVRDNYGRITPMDKDAVNSLRRKLLSVLQGKESVLFHDDDDLLVLLPGITNEALPRRIAVIRAAFQQWKEEQGEGMRGARMNLGYSVSEGEDDLSRTLEVASLLRRPVMDEDFGFAADNC